MSRTYHHSHRHGNVTPCSLDARVNGKRVAYKNRAYGYEYWGIRYSHLHCPGKESKRLTHQWERRVVKKKAIKEGLRE